MEKISFKHFLVNYDPEQDEYLQFRRLRYRRTIADSTSESYEGDVEEAVTMQQRRKMALAMRRNKAKMKMARKRASMRVASLEKLKKRARKKAREFLLKRISKDIPKSELTYAKRQELEKRLDKMKGAIDRIAAKLLPKIRKAEMAKKRGGSTKK